MLSAHSPSRLTLRDQHHDCHTKKSIDQHHTTAADQHQTTRRLIKLPPITLPSISVFLIWSRSNHCSRWTRWSRSNHYCWSTSNHCHTPPITLPSIFVFLFWSRSNHCRRWTRWSRSNHYRRSTSNHCHTKLDQIAAGQLTDVSLFDQWVSGWVGDDLAFELSGFRPKWVSDLVVWSWMVF